MTARDSELEVCGDFGDVTWSVQDSVCTDCEQNHIEEDACGNCGKPGFEGACDSCVELAQREIERARDNPRGDYL